MILDHENQRSLLMQLINQATIKGDSVEVIAEMKQCIINATVQDILQQKTETQPVPKNPKLDTSVMGGSNMHNELV